MLCFIWKHAVHLDAFFFFFVGVCVLQVLHPVCHVRNLMLWTAVYLPSSSPTTPSDDSCAPYPVPGGNPEDTPLSR